MISGKSSLWPDEAWAQEVSLIQGKEKERSLLESLVKVPRGLEEGKGLSS